MLRLLLLWPLTCRMPLKSTHRHTRHTHRSVSQMLLLRVRLLTTSTLRMVHLCIRMMMIQRIRERRRVVTLLLLLLLRMLLLMRKSLVLCVEMVPINGMWTTYH